MTDIVLAAAGQPWVYAAVLLGCLLDGFFPPVPSESVVVGLAALIVTGGGPNPWLLLLAAALGAFVGDNLAYLIGRKLGTRRFRWMRGAFMQRSLNRADSALKRRAVSLILVARFVPVGRVAVNLAAGATAYPWRRFAPISAVSACLWAGYTVGLGALAGSWFGANQLAAVVAAIVLAAVLGLVAEKVSGMLRARSIRAAAVRPGQHNAPGEDAGVEVNAKSLPEGIRV
uniref:DedA family protein n=1 Tax=Arthrobacter sp. ERGS1:01 TaxID=1704044 RepID=UPI000A834B3D